VGRLKRLCRAAFNDHSRMETREDSTTRMGLLAWDRNRVQTKTGRLVEQQHGFDSKSKDGPSQSWRFRWLDKNWAKTA
jgi:hypothetical protein